MKIKIDLNIMSQANSYIEDELNFINPQLGKMIGDVNNISNVWQGAAYKTYSSNTSVFYTELKNLFNSIETANEFLNDYRKAHSTIDDEYRTKIISIQ